MNVTGTRPSYRDVEVPRSKGTFKVYSGEMVSEDLPWSRACDCAFRWGSHAVAVVRSMIDHKACLRVDHGNPETM